MRRRGQVLVWILLAVLALALAGCGSKDQEPEQGQSAATVVAVAQAGRGPLDKVSSISGKLVSALEVNVVPKLGGKVARVNVQVGDRVQAGQLLVQLDTVEITSQVQQAEAAVALVKANMEQAAANRENAQTNLERMEYLSQQGAISQQQLDQARTAMKLADANMDVLRAQQRQSEAGLDLARSQEKNASITAPASGVITARYIEPGEMAGPTMPVVTLTQLDPVLVEAAVGENEINRLREGTAVRVQVAAAGGQEFEGKVTSLSPAADQRTRGYAMQVKLPNPDGILKPGMSASVLVAMEHMDNAVLVPAGAVLERAGRPVVFVALNGKAVQKEVKILLEGTDQVALDGLAEGDAVVVSGQQLLSDGQAIRVADGGKAQ